jgi:GTP-binding protein
MPGTVKITSCQFVGSFYTIQQVPSDSRPHIAFAGRSNVGKSSLLNRLVGIKKMAKVSSSPGKTRALNFFAINDRFYFVDLPGYGYAKVSKQLRAQWGEMIEEYLNRSDRLIGLVLLLDCRRDPTDEDYQLLQWLATRQIPALVAVTKTDKLNRDRTNRKVAQIEKAFGAAAIPFSAVTGTGRSELLAAIAALVNEQKEQKRA